MHVVVDYSEIYFGKLQSAHSLFEYHYLQFLAFATTSITMAPTLLWIGLGNMGRVSLN